MKWQARLTYLWMFLSSASLASPDMRNWQWAPSPQVACACSTISSWHVSASPSMCSTRERRELARRARLYRGGRPLPDVRGRTVILVDDGLATGATMHAAIAALRQQKPTRIVVAVPTASPETCEEMKTKADDVICAITPEPFQAVGRWYQDFSQTTDEEVEALLSRRNVPDNSRVTEMTTADGGLIKALRGTAYRLAG